MSPEQVQEQRISEQQIRKKGTMDINSLLSPSESPAPPRRDSQTPVTPSEILPHPQSPRKHTVHSTSGPLKQLKPSSPVVPPGRTLLSGIPQHVLSPRSTPAISSPLASPSTSTSQNTSSSNGTHSQHVQRTSSTHSMDTLADLASMQNHQPMKATPPLIRNRASYESQLSPSTIFPTVPPVAVTSNPRASFDIAMAETPKQMVRTDYTGTSLPLEMQQTARQHSEYLSSNLSAYQSHVALINILHQGFVNHVYPPDSPQDRGDPRTYDLLSDLRSSRDNMNKLFAVGEDLWADWIQDESMLAQTIEEQVAVMEKCQQAVQEEYSSTKLWTMCGDWILHCYRSAHEAHQKGSAGNLSEEDRLVGRELFTWESVLDTWRQAAEQTKLRLPDSHLIWDRYTQLIMDEMRKSGSNELKEIFQQRLRVPHASWDSTFQAFSTFVSENYLQDYETIMANTNQNAAEAKMQWGAREMLETKLQVTQQVEDKSTEYFVFGEYVQWEQRPEKGRRKDHELINMLFQRAELRFPSNAELWEDHYLWLIDEGRQNMSPTAALKPLSLLDRATRHCPWSGSLWSAYLIQSESQGQSFQQTQEIKHKATNTGLLDVGGMEEVLKFHKVWCSYLRRQAFRAGATDEDLDVAEMGIRSSIENVQELATKQGLSQNFDPLFRLERLYVAFLSKKGSWDSAREVWRGLIAIHGDSCEFWMKYYGWEMVCYSTFVNNGRIGSDGLGKETPNPHYATALLKEALKRPTLDWPEKLMETLIAHCEDHEEVEDLQLAIIDMKKLQKTVASRRENERLAAEMAEVQKEHLKEEAKEVAEVVAGDQQSTKRKRDAADGETSNKRSRNTTIEAEGSVHSTALQKNPERDRENATILVQNLPENVTETRIRQLFRDCGTINSLKLSREPDVSAVVEFDEKEAAQYALSKDGKDFDGVEISVQIGVGSVLFVANYPPTADEAYIRTIFEKFGTILEVRFPSLINNTHRRFCYVHFERAVQAKAATVLDDTEIEEGQKLTAKISDPSHKQGRSGPLEEGREIYVRNIFWGATEKDVKKLFSKYGKVESVRIPRNLQGKSKGFAFVVYISPDEANKALDADTMDYRGREIHVEISSKTGAKRQATTIVSRVDRSETPSTALDGEAASPTTNSVTSVNEGQQTTGDRHERTIALMDIPQTVNDSRIRALAETHGKLIKVSLRPGHQGAIIEYIDSRDAAKASLSLDGHEIDPGRKLRVGTVPEMMKQKPEQINDRIVVGKAKENGTHTLQVTVPVKRPGQPGQRKGGGLGLKRGLGFKNSYGYEDMDVEGGKGGKSNDDFRAMLEKK